MDNCEDYGENSPARDRSGKLRFARALVKSGPEVRWKCMSDGPLEARGRLVTDSPVATSPRVARPPKTYLEKKEN